MSIGRGRHRFMIAEHRHLVEQGAQLVELRLDYINGEVNIRRLLADRPCPVVISCRRERDGGKWNKGEEKRLLLLRTAIAEGAEYVDLEEDIAAQIPRYGKTRRIISYHDFHKTPEDLEALHRHMCGLDPDIVKISTMANHPHDNLRMLRLIRQSKIPTIGICMGEIGIPTRILAGKYGAPFTFATFHHERALAPGQLTFQQMKEIYRYDEINEQTELYGVVADPVAHSLSPLIHNTAFQHLGLNKVYVPFRVPREHLGQFLEDCQELGVKGLSVTIPHKEAIVPRLTQADGAVRGIGACNTVIFKDGQLVGYNTDYRAAMESLEEALGIPPNVEAPLQGKTALILGAGGVGKTIAYGLLRRGAHVVVTDGIPEKAQQLAEQFQCRFAHWSVRHTVPADILVNATPIGMHPNVDETPFERRHMKPSMVVFDVVYNPENTLFIKEARAQNCKVITGLEMFVRQAALQFKLFTGLEPPVDLMRDVVRRAIAAVKY